MNSANKMIISVVVAAIIIIWLIMSSGCSSVGTLHGPHTSTTMTNHEWDIERRNIYSDGWQDSRKAMKYE